MTPLLMWTFRLHVTTAVRMFMEPIISGEPSSPDSTEFDLMRLFSEVEMPLVPILVDMETTGIRIDPEILSGLSREFSEKLVRLEEEIYQLAGEKFNIQSPKQLGRILFDQMRLPYGRKTKTGYSTDMRVLEKLALRHDLPAKIINIRTVAKLLSTYVEKLTELMDKEDGKGIYLIQPDRSGHREALKH